MGGSTRSGSIRGMPRNNTDSQLFSYSLDGGNTWSANVAVSDPFDPYLGFS